MNKPFKKQAVVIMCTSQKELNSFKRYKAAKNDDEGWTFKFDISRKNDVKIAITEHVK